MIRLRESFSDWSTDTKDLIKEIKLTEKVALVEFANQSFTPLSAFYIPVWRLDQKNRNGRVYEYALGEKICKENKVTGVLDGHPSDDHEVRIDEVIAVAKNPKIENTSEGPIMFVEVYIIDKTYDERIRRATELGMTFEQSSSGFGELDKDNKVITESYILERYCDLLVQDSSYQVGFGKENAILHNKTENLEQKTQENSSTNYKNDTRIIAEKSDDGEKEKSIMADNTLISFEDKIIKRNIKSNLREALKLEDPKARVTELKEIATFFGDFSDRSVGSDLESELKESLEAAENEILELAEKGKELDTVIKEKEETVSSLDEAKARIKELEESEVSLKEKLELTNKKLDFAFEEMDKSKETYLGLKELYERKSAEVNTLVDPENYVELAESHKKSEAKLAIAIAEMDKIKEAVDSGALKESRKKKPLTNEEKETRRKRIAEAVEKNSEEGAPVVEGKVSIKEKIGSKKSITEAIEDANANDTPVARTFLQEKLDSEREAINQYFSKLSERYGAEVMEEYKEVFDACKTKSDAVQTYLKVKRFLNESKGIPSTERRSIIGRKLNERDQDNSDKLSELRKKFGGIDYLKKTSGFKI